MLELTHCLMNGDQMRFSTTLRSITEQYGNRPEVMARLQQLLMSVGILRPTGRFANVSEVQPSGAYLAVPRLRQRPRYGPLAAAHLPLYLQAPHRPVANCGFRAWIKA